MSEATPNNELQEPGSYAPGHTRTWNNSWQDLYDGWGDVILAFALRQGLNHQSAQNVRQEVMMTLLRSQHGETAAYDSRKGSFSSWIWGVIRNRVKSERRKHGREVLESSLPGTDDGAHGHRVPVLVDPPPDFALAEEAQQRQAVWVAALQKVRQKVKPENFEIYAALLQESATPEKLAAQHGKTTNNVYAIKHRCDDLLVQAARAILEDPGNLHANPAAVHRHE